MKRVYYIYIYNIFTLMCTHMYARMQSDALSFEVDRTHERCCHVSVDSEENRSSWNQMRGASKALDVFYCA